MKTADSSIADALRAALGKIPILCIQDIEVERGTSNWNPDLSARVSVNGRTYILICEHKSNAQPRYARSAILQLQHYIAQCAPEAIPVFIAPYISPAVRRLCEESGVGYFDFEGNARISFDSVYIERVVADKPLAERRELKSLFRPKSAQVLRTLLRDPHRVWRVADLANASGVSLGHVSNVRTGLIDREWAEVSKDGLRLSMPDMLLDAWRESYTAPVGERYHFYTPLHGNVLEKEARGVLGGGSASGRAAFASFSAAQWLAPYARTGMHYFVADGDGLRRLQSALKLSFVTKGENVIVTVPKDLALLFDTVEPAPGAVCTSPIQTYLDLSINGERGSEAADHLREEMLSWSK